MGKECGARLSRRLWGGSNTSPLKTTAWEATGYQGPMKIEFSKGAGLHYQWKLFIIPSFGLNNYNK